MGIVETKRLTKRFKTVTAVNSLSLSVEKGEIFGLVGPDGAGKTTTLRLLAALMDPTEGEAFVSQFHTVKQAELLKEKIGYMSQQFGLYPDLTVDENIHFYADIYDVPRSGRQEKIDTLLNFSGLLPFKGRLADKLSGGMKQKLGLACALIHTPDILFLDEPTCGVDPVSRRDFWQILMKLSQEGVTLFLTTSYLDEAERCDRVGFLHQGELLAMGAPKEVKEQYKGVVWEIVTENSRRAAQALKQVFGPGTVRLFGRHIHLYTEDTHQVKERIEKALVGKPFKYQTIPPSLEDLFITFLK